MISLQTTRLLLRPFNENDLNNLIELDQDPEVMKYLGNQITPIEKIKEGLSVLIERQPRWKTYGTWCADLLSTGENIGWFTLKPVPAINNEYEIGYRLKKKFWGYGYATEGSEFLIEYGFKQLHLPKIIGLTDPHNKASQHVLQKCGLVYKGDIANPWPILNIDKTSYFELFNPNQKAQN